jgi:hypothetical protein
MWVFLVSELLKMCFFVLFQNVKSVFFLFCSVLGTSFVAVASPSAIASLSAPLSSLISSAGLSGGDLTFISTDFGSSSGSTATSFWDRFSTWPLFKLSGISGSSVWLVVFSVFFLYVAAILYIDGGLLFSGILRSLNIGGGQSFNPLILAENFLTVSFFYSNWSI